MDETEQGHPAMSVSYRGRLRDTVYFTWYHLMRSPGLVAIDLLLAGYVTWVGCSSLDGETGPVVLVLTCVLFFTIVFSALFVLGFAGGALRALFVRDKMALAENTIEL
ncbi:MAG: hypothetical protein ACYS9X_15795, partial [Planctomycetota bacterium]